MEDQIHVHMSDIAVVLAMVMGGYFGTVLDSPKAPWISACVFGLLAFGMTI